MRKKLLFIISISITFVCTGCSYIFSDNTDLIVRIETLSSIVHANNDYSMTIPKLLFTEPASAFLKGSCYRFVVVEGLKPKQALYQNKIQWNSHAL